MKNPKEVPDDVSVHSILTEIKNKTLDPSALTKPVRQLCVEALMFEGYQPSALAQLLHVSDKTIKRDLQEIYERNTVAPSPELAKQLIGEYLQKMRIHHSCLVRLARGKEGTIQEKAQAEYLAWRTLKEAMQLLQSLGYLPARPQEITGSIIHHKEKEEDLTLTEVKATIQQIEETARQCGGISPEVEKKVERLKLEVQKAELSDEALNLQREINQNGTTESKEDE